MGKILRKKYHDYGTYALVLPTMRKCSQYRVARVADGFEPGREWRTCERVEAVLAFILQRSKDRRSTVDRRVSNKRFVPAACRQEIVYCCTLYCTAVANETDSCPNANTTSVCILVVTAEIETGDGLRRADPGPQRAPRAPQEGRRLKKQPSIRWNCCCGCDSEFPALTGGSKRGCRMMFL